MWRQRLSSIRRTGQSVAEPPKSSDARGEDPCAGLGLVVGHLAVRGPGPNRLGITASTVVPGGESGVVVSISIP